MNEVKIYRKKPVTISAVRVSTENVQDVADWCGGRLNIYQMPIGPYYALPRKAISIPTLEGAMRADPGDYVIRGVHGEFYACKPDIFAETYEEVQR